MTDGNPQSGKITFVQRHKPPIMAGDYQIKVTQSFKGSAEIEQDTPFEHYRYVSVRGERFSLDPGEVVAVFPPVNNRGEYQHTLPHVVLSRRTLPWERALDLEPQGSPAELEPVGLSWLALLLFEQDEAPAIRTMTVGDLQRDKLPAEAASYPDGFAAIDKDEPFDLAWGEQLADPVQVIDVDFALFSAIAPSLNDLQWLAHVRTVASDKKAGGAQDAVQDNAVVVGNRLPRKDTTCVAHLVSLERMGRFLPDDDGTPAKTKLISGGDPKSIRLVSLKSWSFTSIDPDETFDGYLTNLTFTCGPLQHSYDDNKSADATAATAIKGAFDRGYTAMSHLTRLGDVTVSWYRGPLVPFAASGAIVPAPPESGAGMIGVADQATRFDPETGMMDVSYAAAWQVGRLLALQSPTFSAALYNWKREASRAVALHVEQQAVLAHFAPMLAGRAVPSGPGRPFAPFVSAMGAPARPRELGHALKAAIVNEIATRLAAQLAPAAFPAHHDGTAE